MATILKWDGVGVADETTLTTSTAGTGDTPLESILGTAGIVDADVLFKGGPSVRVTPAASTAARHVWQVNTRTSATYGWVYTTPAAWTSTAYNIFGIRTNGGTLQCRINLAGTGSPGQIRLANNAGTTIASSANSTIAFSTTYWMELQVNQSASTCRLRVWNLASGASVYDTGALTGAAIGTTHDEFTIGSYDPSPVPGQFRFGRLIADDTQTTWGTPPNLSAQSFSGSADLTGTGTLTASGTASSVGAGTVALTGSGSLAATGAPAVSGAATLTGSGSLTAGSTRYQGAQTFDGGGLPFTSGANPTAATTAGGRTGLGMRYTIANAAQLDAWDKATLWGDGKNYGALAMWLRMPTLPTTGQAANRGVALLTVRSSNPNSGTGNGHLDFFYTPSNGFLAWDLLAENAGVYPSFPAGAWVYLQVKWKFGTGTWTADVRINGVDQTSIASIAPGDFDTSRIVLGTSSTDQTYTYDVDDITFATDSAPVDFVGAAAASGSASMSGSGVLATAASVAFAATAALTGSGGLSVTGSPAVARTASLAGAGALTAYSQTILELAQDLVGLSEAIALERSLVLDESVAVTDVAVSTLTSETALADDAPATDAVTAELAGATAQGITEPLGLSDDVASSQGLSRAFADTLGARDAVSLARATSSSDQLAVTDAIAARQNLSLPISDGMGALDAVSAEHAAPRDAVDAVGVSDTVGVVMVRFVEVADLVQAADQVATDYLSATLVEDGVAVTDRVLADLGRGLNLDAQAVTHIVTEPSPRRHVVTAGQPQRHVVTAPGTARHVVTEVQPARHVVQ